jgi:hypothetical protein
LKRLKNIEQANANGSAVMKQHIYRSEEEILKHLSDQEESEISMKEYCEMFDINEQTFNSWIKKYRGKEDKDDLHKCKSFLLHRRSLSSLLKLEI